MNFSALALGAALVATGPCFAPPAALAQQPATTAAAKAAFDASVARPVSADDLKKRMDAGERVVVVDARDDLAGEIIKGAAHVPEEKLVAWSEHAPKDVPLVFYCTCDDDGLGKDAVVGLQNLGFTNAYYLKGGLEAARKAGVPIVKPTE